MSPWTSLLYKQKTYEITKFLPQTEYTVSINGTYTDPVEVWLTTLNVDEDGIIETEVNQDNAVYIGDLENNKLTFTAQESHTALVIRTRGNLELTTIQLEKGTLATDWILAPEEQEERLSSLITQTVDGIRTEVSETYVSNDDLGEYKNEVSTRFTQTSDAFNFDFNTLQTEVNDLESDTQTKLTEIDKYIRFENGNIIVGDRNSHIKLVLENDIIKFEQNGEPVAYIDNNRLFITDGQFLNSLDIGNFAFIPRTNGNLSFGKVVG